jgi:hypothetical protein
MVYAKKKTKTKFFSAAITVVLSAHQNGRFAHTSCTPSKLRAWSGPTVCI